MKIIFEVILSWGSRSFLEFIINSVSKHESHESLKTRKYAGTFLESIDSHCVCHLVKIGRLNTLIAAGLRGVRAVGVMQFTRDPERVVRAVPDRLSSSSVSRDCCHERERDSRDCRTVGYGCIHPPVWCLRYINVGGATPRQLLEWRGCLRKSQSATSVTASLPSRRRPWPQREAKSA